MTATPPDGLRELLAFAEELADAARGIARSHFRSHLGFDAKSDRTPVTLADRAIERTWREAIASRYPSHSILGEEESSAADFDVAARAEWTWVLDPIDGTKSFATGNPMFGCLIGLRHRGRNVLGVLDAPALGERYRAAVGLGAWHDEEPIAVRPPRSLSDAVAYCTTAAAMFEDAGWQELQQRIGFTQYGADCLAYAFLASGHVDLIVDRDLRPWDWCALAALVTAAGGAITDWAGAPLDLHARGDVVAASSAQLADAARGVLCKRRGFGHA
ncbi:MAG: inositol monophosphatase family protein [Planctomycetota bacterium]